MEKNPPLPPKKMRKATHLKEGKGILAFTGNYNSIFDQKLHRSQFGERGQSPDIMIKFGHFLDI